jgi:hypothetical protein
MLQGNVLLLSADGGGNATVNCIVAAPSGPSCDGSAPETACHRAQLGWANAIGVFGDRGSFPWPAVAAAGQAATYPLRAMAGSVGDEDKRRRRGCAEAQQAPESAKNIGLAADAGQLSPRGTWC